jgi:hypothetical protein
VFEWIIAYPCVFQKSDLSTSLTPSKMGGMVWLAPV